MATVHAGPQNQHSPKPTLNLSDLPELVPTSRRRRPRLQEHLGQFGKRSVSVYQEDAHHQATGLTVGGHSIDATIAVAELIAMFPSLDPQLMQAIVAEAPTVQLAMETLLALASALMEPLVVPRDDPSQVGGGPLPCARVETHEHFPILVDADGWQVMGVHESSWHLVEIAECSWSDRAKHGAKMHASRVGRPQELAGAASREPSDLNVLEEVVDESQQFEPDDEYLRRKGPGHWREQGRARRIKAYHMRQLVGVEGKRAENGEIHPSRVRALPHV